MMYNIGECTRFNFSYQTMERFRECREIKDDIEYLQFGKFEYKE